MGKKVKIFGINYLFWSSYWENFGVLVVGGIGSVRSTSIDSSSLSLTSRALLPSLTYGCAQFGWSSNDCWIFPKYSQ